MSYYATLEEYLNQDDKASSSQSETRSDKSSDDKSRSTDTNTLKQ